MGKYILIKRHRGNKFEFTPSEVFKSRLKATRAMNALRKEGSAEYDRVLVCEADVLRQVGLKEPEKKPTKAHRKAGKSHASGSQH